MEIKGSLFAKAEIGAEGMRNLVGNALFDEYLDAARDIIDLYASPEDLDRLIHGQAPDNGIPKDDLPRTLRFQVAIDTVRDKARTNGIPVTPGYIVAGGTPCPTWYLDTDTLGEVFELKLTPMGRKVATILGKSSIAFSTDVH